MAVRVKFLNVIKFDVFCQIKLFVLTKFSLSFSNQKSFQTPTTKHKEKKQKQIVLSLSIYHLSLSYVSFFRFVSIFISFELQQLASESSSKLIKYHSF